MWKKKDHKQAQKQESVLRLQGASYSSEVLIEPFSVVVEAVGVRRNPSAFIVAGDLK